MSIESSDLENTVTVDLTGSSFFCVMDTEAIHSGLRVREIERVSKINVGKFGYEEEGREQEVEDDERSAEDNVLLPLFVFFRAVVDSQQN